MLKIAIVIPILNPNNDFFSNILPQLQSQTMQSNVLLINSGSDIPNGDYDLLKIDKKDFIQAKAFLDVHREQLSVSQQIMLKDLSEWENAGFWKHRWLIIRYRLWEKGMIRNIGLMVFA